MMYVILKRYYPYDMSLFLRPSENNDIPILFILEGHKVMKGCRSVLSSPNAKVNRQSIIRIVKGIQNGGYFRNR